MNYVSKKMGKKRAAVREVSSSVDESVGELAPAVEKLLFKDNVPDSLTVEELLLRVASLPQEDFKRYEDWETALAMARDEVVQIRDAREVIFADGRENTGVARRWTLGNYGEKAVRSMGLRGATPETPDDLLTFTKFALMQLKKGFGKFKPVAGDPDATEIVEMLEKTVVDLTKVKDDLEAAERKVDTLLVKRNKAAAAWQQHEGPVTTVIKSLMKLVEMDELSKKVRSKKRSKSAKDESEDAGEDLPKEEVKAEKPETPVEPKVIEVDVKSDVVDVDEPSKDDEKPEAPVS